MTRKLGIKLNGDIELDDFTITGLIKITELPEYFTATESTPLQVLGKKIQVQFSNAEIELTDSSPHLSLRFEDGILVSIFITVKELDNQYKNAEDFYIKSGERRSQYKRWLNRHISFNIKDFAAGSIGVGEDKSNTVFIYLHTKNNNWATI
ncbi:hypothetical protein MP477_17570 [Chryseobacterium sp. WG23]|uniref:hypothetical protein n=1 Tax=Chryseobacterium sp. WG23 TaxID=2926910 RepID=UPI00211EECD6|nr:hypothetical protein [Chryseobacterium sp. WG23]MCQ9636767.1 hypothetical protein [Chryseobacterium sp. WG23]